MLDTTITKFGYRARPRDYFAEIGALNHTITGDAHSEVADLVAALFDVLPATGNTSLLFKESLIRGRGVEYVITGSPDGDCTVTRDCDGRTKSETVCPQIVAMYLSASKGMPC